MSRAATPAMGARSAPDTPAAAAAGAARAINMMDRIETLLATILGGIFLLLSAVVAV